MNCPSCASELPVGARFCPSCGHRVESRGDERRVATVLFADLAGFTGLSESLDPEHVKNLVDRCFARLAVDITSHGGRVDKVVGDAIVGLFGAPVAHEDDAERAVRAGLQMQQSIAALAEELRLPLRLRVGINSGEVLVGAIRAGGDYTAMGDVVNVASRLQSMGAPGTVVVGPATHGATASVVRYEPLGPLQARGRDEPVTTWRAVECVAPPGRRPRRVVAPLLGRDDELALLRHTTEVAVHRCRPQLVVVLGEAGMGKSRLTEELARWATTAHGALVLEGRCVPYGEANPWWPVAEAVRQACGIDSGDPADAAAAKCRAAVGEVCGVDASGDEAAQLAAGLLHLMGDEDALRDVDPQRARQEARRSLTALLSGLARRQPLLLILSELHWADDLVLELVGPQLDRIGGLPVVLVATARPELAERWASPQGRHNLVLFHLDALDTDHARQLASALLEGGAPDYVLDTLVERSGGNPFFLEELISYLGDAAPGSMAEAAAPGELPATLRGLVAARLDALGGEERSVLEDAAVIGRSGSITALTALSRSRGGGDVEAVLARLLDHDLLTVTDGEWEFRSDVVREVVYEILTKSERARRHWSLASWLTDAARKTGREDEVLEQIAHHHATAAELVAEVGPAPGLPADVAASAVGALARAASWAMRRELPLVAARLLDRALPLAAAGSADRRRVLLDRALARATLRELEAARADLADVLAVEDPEAHARALAILGQVQQSEGDLAASQATLSDAVEAFRRLGDAAGEGDALRRHGFTRLMSGDLHGAEEAFGEALEIARRLDNRRDEAWALWHLAWVAFTERRTEEAERRLNQAGQAFLEAGDTGGISWVRGLLGYVRLSQGRREEAERLALGILDQVRDRGDRWAAAMTLALLAAVRLWQGRAAAAAGPAAEARALFGEIGDTGGQLHAAAILARALVAAGSIDEALAVAEECWSLDGGHEPTASYGQTGAAAVAGVATHIGDWRTGLDVTAATTAGAGAIDQAALRALALLQADQPAEGRALLEELAELEQGPGAGDSVKGTMSPHPNVLALLGLARVATGDPGAGAEAAAEVLAGGAEATYRDLALAHVARAFAHLQGGNRELLEADFESARELVSGTDDLVTAAVVELARAHAIEAAGAATGQGTTTDARAALTALGVVHDGWDSLWHACAHPARAAAP